MPTGEQASFSVEASGEGGHRVALSGAWTLGAVLPPVDRVLAALRAAGAEQACVDSGGVERYDSVLPAFLFELAAAGERAGIKLTEDGLPGDVTRLLGIARSVPARDDGKRSGPSGIVGRFGHAIMEGFRSAADLLRFFGRGIAATGELLTGRSAMRMRDLTDIFVGVTVAALPIVSLISLLVGLIIAFLGAVVLRQFAAEFAVAYLVGYGMLREMGAVMTGVIMAGRTGAGFAAEIGSMRVNEEIDALETFGIRPFGFLVLPRVIALSIAMPLLTVYANVVGIFGGYLVSDFMIGVPAPIFFEEMVRVVGVKDFWLGVFKGYVFGIVVALSGCLRGLQCGSGAGAVGIAATRAVVLGITLIIICNAIIDWAAATLGI
ncbi:MAG: ABC transporter permease [Opitutales bacterium]|nr:ABC transporter permease [Opitutales bacterium]